MSAYNSVVEYQPSKLIVVGSSPTARSTNRHVGPVAQLVEQRAFNPLVEGSSPFRPTSRMKKHGLVAQLVEQLTLNQKVVSSTLTRSTIREIRASSSAGQSIGFLPRVSGVRIPPGSPKRVRKQRKEKGFGSSIGRAPISKIGGCGFKSRPARHLRRWCNMKQAHIAQLVEHHVANVKVASSRLAVCSNASVAQLVEHSPCKRAVAGSNPGQGLHSFLWARSSVGRASALQAEGRRFNSCRVHQSKLMKTVRA